MARSFLFVPADSERKLAKASEASADALILDLEDSVHPARKRRAREVAAAFIAAQPRRGDRELWVRINALGSEHALADLAAIVGPRLAGIVLPKVRAADDVCRAGHYLDALEAVSGTEPGAVGILAIVTESARAVLHLGSYDRDLPRMRGVTWGAEDLNVEIGAASVRDEGGAWLGVFEQIQSSVLVAACAAGAQPIETIYADYKDLEGLRASAGRARQLGFTGMLAIHPSQLAVINATFAPSEQEVEYARRVLAAFDAAGDVGVAALDGRMLDKPHRERARRLLASRGSEP